VKADISNEAEVDRAVDEVIRRYGKIDVLVDNAAGSAPAVPVETLDLSIWRRTMETNVDGMFIVAKAVANKSMIPNRSGKIVIFCSIASEIFRIGSFTGAYETSKGAVATMVKMLDSNWNRYGINVNGIAPGYILSDIVLEMFEKDPVEVKKAIYEVNAAGPDILVVGLGTPKQEYFIYENLSALNVPLSLGLGASLDFEAGKVKRAPGWMSDHGLEWLYRCIQEPRRLTGRYAKDAFRLLRIIRNNKRL